MPAKTPPAKKAATPKATARAKSAASGKALAAVNTAKIARSESERFVINGVDELKLVNQYPKIPVQPAPGKPRHLTSAQISAMVKLMKVA